MKKRINNILVGIAEFSMILAMFAVGFIFYQGFENQIFEDLRVTAHLFAELDYNEIDDGDGQRLLENELRITVVGPDGDVVYDNNASVDDMSNHGDREEIESAMETGEGMSARYSDTLGTKSYYYAVRMDDGNIIRVAKESSTIGRVFYQFSPVILILIIGLAVLCMIVAGFFTKKLVEPIEYLANHLEEEDQKGIYPELVPFMNMIKTQHDDIMKGARMRQDFTANVSHELKTPLTSISGYSELIENGMATSEDTKRFAKEIHKNSTRLLTLINDIIRLSELDSTDASGAFEPVSLYDIAGTCVEMLQVNAEKHQVSLTFWGEPCDVRGTKEMLEELVYNLCDNAIRYNNVNGSVHVSVKNLGDKAVLTVSDTGIGIQEKHQSRIFERFYRVDKSRSKSTGGTGLGLAIVKHIVSQLSASIKLESEPGKGTRIEVTFIL